MIHCVYFKSIFSKYNISKIQLKSLIDSKPSGHVSILIVGGALEALEGQTNEVRLILNRRKGFIKLALRFGVDLVPTFSFGEQFIYTQADNAKGNI